MNHVALIGNLTRNPEAIQTRAGTAGCRFTIAVNRPSKTEQKADFIPIKAFGQRAELCMKYLTKGAKVGITGSISTYTYTAQDGSNRSMMEVIVDDVTFLSSRAEGQTAAQATTATPQGFTPIEDEESLSELPF